MYLWGLKSPHAHPRKWVFDRTAAYGALNLAARASDLPRLPVFPLKQKTVQVQGNQRQHFLAPLFSQLLFLGERRIDFVLDPPAIERRFGTTEQNFVPKPDAPVHRIVDVVSRQELILIQPTTNSPALELVVQPPCKGLVLMAVAYETGVKLNGLGHQRRNVLNKRLANTGTSEEGLRNLFFGRTQRVDIDIGTSALRCYLLNISILVQKFQAKVSREVY